MNRRKLAGWLLPILILGFAAVCLLQTKIDQQRNSMRVGQEHLAFRSGKLIEALSLEYATFMGAVYWTRVVQYFGEKHRLHQTNLELLWPLLDIATTLDPQLIPAYRFGSTFLSDSPPRGAGRPDLAVKLLDRGIKANPDQWRLYQDLGNVYYFDAKDYAKASAAFADGSKNPNALIWMKVMAAKIAAEGESPETSYFLWLQVYQTTPDPRVKQNAEEHLKLMKVQLDIQEINRLGDEFEKRTGRRPSKMNDLVQAGLLKEVPTDSEGYAYTFGDDGKAELNLDSPLLEKQVMDKR
jgi:hypothetical protein